MQVHRVSTFIKASTPDPNIDKKQTSTPDHTNNKTKRRFLPNLNDVTLQAESLGRGFKMRITAAALRSVDHRGGLDAFLLKAKDSELSDNALKIKKEVVKSQAAEA